MSAAYDVNRLPLLNIGDDLLYRISARFVFDTLVNDIVRGYYALDPLHVTLQVQAGEVMLFVIEPHTTHFKQDPLLLDWAVEFIAGDIFNVAPGDVDVIYLDGKVGADDACIHLVGGGVYISCGEPDKRGLYL